MGEREGDRERQTHREIERYTQKDRVKREGVGERQRERENGWSKKT